MMDLPVISDDEQWILSRLQYGRDLRVWSVIVTIMGDMARAPGDTISGATLAALMSTLGIRPEATRVALHRLRKDGWIASERSGRGSNYALTDLGRHQTVAVADRIYGPDLSAPITWHLAISPGLGSKTSTLPTPVEQGFIEITTGVFLGTTPLSDPSDFVYFLDSNANLPDWVKSRILSPDLNDDITNLSAALHDIREFDSGTAHPAMQAAIRILVLHKWRRIVLKLPSLPLALLRPDVHLYAQVQEFLKKSRNINFEGI